MLGERKREPKKRSLQDAAVSVAKKLRESGFEAFFAGGCVRDMVMGSKPEDYDIATNATPETVQSIFKHTIPVGVQFGVVIVLEGGSQFEVATFRSDGRYTDGRRPDEVRFGTAEEDVLRRDFTINGMLYDPIKRKLIDYIGGQEDIKKRLIRCIGNPQERFSEDKLRLLRAVRFATRFGFEIEEETRKAITAFASSVSAVSQERIREELEKILADANRSEGVRELQKLGLLPYLLPELSGLLSLPIGAKLFDHSLAVLGSLSSFDFPLSFAALMHEVGVVSAGESHAEESAKLTGRAARRLRFSNAQRKKAVFFVLNQNACDGAENQPLHKLKRLLAEEESANLLLLMEAKAKCGCAKESDVNYIRDLSSRLTRQEIAPEPFLRGEDLIAAGLTPSALFTTILESVYDAQLDGKVATRDEALSLAKKIVQGQERGLLPTE
jgi:poly(A) polymerase